MLYSLLDRLEGREGWDDAESVLVHFERVAKLHRQLEKTESQMDIGVTTNSYYTVGPNRPGREFIRNKYKLHITGSDILIFWLAIYTRTYSVLPDKHNLRSSAIRDIQEPDLLREYPAGMFGFFQFGRRKNIEENEQFPYEVSFIYAGAEWFVILSAEELYFLIGLFDVDLFGGIEDVRAVESADGSTEYVIDWEPTDDE